MGASAQGRRIGERKKKSVNKTRIDDEAEDEDQDKLKDYEQDYFNGQNAEKAQKVKSQQEFKSIKI